jgi:hypothetical protein
VKKFAPKHQAEFTSLVKNESLNSVDEVFLPVICNSLVDIQFEPKLRLSQVSAVGLSLIALGAGRSEIPDRLLVNGCQDSALSKFGNGSALLPLI